MGRFSVDAWVEDLEAVVDAAGLAQFSLLGPSNAGAVAIAYAVRHPERVSHLVLCGRHGTGWVNHVTRVVPDTPVPCSPVLCAPFVTAPTLMMVAPDDEMRHGNYHVARDTYDLLPSPKQWHDIAGGHFGLLYHPSPLFDEAVSVQTAFLERWLLPTG